MHLPELAMAIGSFVAGASALKRALKSKDQSGDLALLAPARGNRPRGRIRRVHTIDDRLAGVMEQMNRSIRDPQIRWIAGQLVSRRCSPSDPKKGRGGWCYPERAYWKEVTAIYQYVRANVRYVRDIHGIDTFQTAARTLEMRSGDCFPDGTLVLREDGQLVPIQQIVVGDRIHDGEGFVEVLKTWDRGPKTIHRIGLNNADTLRLSDQHKVLVVPKVRRNTQPKAPGMYGTQVEKRVHELCVGDDLLQPREFGGGSVELEHDDAILVAMYLAEGWKSADRTRTYLAGVENGKGYREIAESILTKRGVKYSTKERQIQFVSHRVPILDELDLGRVAIEKGLPHLSWGPNTVRKFLEVLDGTDGGKATNGKNVVFSTISYTLALQYRVMQRMMGRSTSLKRLDDHGGAGTNPIYRVMARVDDHRRPWAKIRSIEVEDDKTYCCDLMTASGKVYLPESDVIVRNCDDFTITLGALLMAVGFPVRTKTIQTTNASDFNHIYLQVGLPPTKPKVWKSLDASTPNGPGWEAPKSMIARARLDYPEDGRWRQR